MLCQPPSWWHRNVSCVCEDSVVPQQPKALMIRMSKDRNAWSFKNALTSLFHLYLLISVCIKTIYDTSLCMSEWIFSKRINLKVHVIILSHNLLTVFFFVTLKMAHLIISDILNWWNTIVKNWLSKLKVRAQK